MGKDLYCACVSYIESTGQRGASKLAVKVHNMLKCACMCVHVSKRIDTL